MRVLAPDKQFALLTALRRGGQSKRAIAKLIGVTPNTVLRYANQGMPGPDRWCPKTEAKRPALDVYYFKGRRCACGCGKTTRVYGGIRAKWIQGHVSTARKGRPQKRNGRRRPINLLTRLWRGKSLDDGGGHKQPLHDRVASDSMDPLELLMQKEEEDQCRPFEFESSSRLARRTIQQRVRRPDPQFVQYQGRNYSVVWLRRYASPDLRRAALLSRPVRDMRPVRFARR